jgi:DNA polymerase I-like protein with 3'-5' exonuclease and polymerase domains
MNGVHAGDLIVLDLETFDPHLTTLGTDAHCRRWGGYVFMCGIIHPESGREEIRPWNAATKALLRSWLDQGMEWVGANVKYDLNWLLSEGVMEARHVHYKNRFHDILINAPLLDETQLPGFYSLDGQCSYYDLPTKPVEDLLAAATSVGLRCTEKTVRGLLYKLPWDIVAEYCLHDIRQTLAVYRHQQPLIKENKLEGVVTLEERLLPVLCLMEQRGIRVDVAAAEQLHDDTYAHINQIKAELQAANGGHEVPLSASKALTNFLQGRGHVLPKTAKGKDSTKADVLDSLANKDPLVRQILIARKAEKIAKDFCQGTIINSHHNGRVYPNINQLVAKDEKAADGTKGVRYGRMSYTDKLHQVPKHDRVGFDDTGGLGTAMRRLFIAEDDCQFMSADFSSQEPRWIVHWTETWGIPGASAAGDQYRSDPKTDYHSMVAKMADVPRPMAKIINLGKGYEMGKTKLIMNLIAAGADPANADSIIEQYDRNFPHVSAGSRAAMAAADRLGYVRTYAGRKLHFNLFEPVVRGAGAPLPYEEAHKKYVMSETRRMPIKRAYCYRAFNRIIQGSSADQTKMAMVSLWYDHGILPTMQIHDELTAADITSTEQAMIYKNVMENVVKLTIPCLTEVKIGPNWKEGELLEVPV